MSKYNYTQQDKDPQLWRIAQARASFRSHLTTYLIMSVFFWAVWFFTENNRSHNGFPWPVWPMFGWGIGVFFHYIGAYVTPRRNRAEEEYQKLIDQQNKQ